MKQHAHTSLSLALAGVLMASTLGGAFVPAAQARQKGSKTFGTAAIAGGILGGYGLLKHNRTATIAGLGVAGYSVYRRQQAIKNERRQRRYGYTSNRYVRTRRTRRR